MVFRTVIGAVILVSLSISGCTLPGVPTTVVEATGTPNEKEIIPTNIHTPTLDPSGPIIARGMEYHASGDFKSALDEFEKAVDFNPESYEAHFQRGRVLVDINEYKPALAEFERALSIDPTRAEAFNGRGVVRTKMGKYEDALKDFGLAIIIRPNYSEAFSNRGITYVQMGDLETGIAEFNQALKIHSGNVEAYYNRALAYAILGDSRATEDFQKVLEISDDPELRRVATEYLEGSSGTP